MMIRHSIAYRDARNFVSKGRANLGMPKQPLRWTDDGRQECEQLVDESKKTSNSAFVDNGTASVRNHRADLDQAEESKGDEDNKTVEREQDDEDEDEDEEYPTIPHATVYLSIKASHQSLRKGGMNQELRMFDRMPSDCSTLRESVHGAESILESIQDIEISGTAAGLDNPESAFVCEKLNPNQGDDDNTKATVDNTELGGVPSVIYIFVQVKAPRRNESLLSKVSKNFRLLGSKRASPETITFGVEDAEYCEHELVSL
jgi:hypothetical protein